MVGGALAGSWAREDPEAAFAWANTLPNGQGRDNAMQSIFSNWAGKDPQRAANVVATLPSGPRREQAMGSVSREWANLDPRAAIAWAQSLSATSQTTALRSIV